jgi:N-dimethylarginine dimethylaminohydrolase
MELAKMKILMCRPTEYAIQYEINPWMDISRGVNKAIALQQWEKLYNTILSCAAKVELISGVAGLPDMVFTANAGLVLEKKVVLANFKHKERQGERQHFASWFTQAGFTILNPSADHAPYFEGAGDALFAGDTLFVGYGIRSDRHFYEQAAYLPQADIVYCELINPYFYHLDTCFCPLTPELAIWYPSAFTPESQDSMKKKIELLSVNQEEAQRFACNAVVINKHIILPTHCPQLTTSLEQRGFLVHACDMDEYLKAGGACKCLTLQLE